MLNPQILFSLPHQERKHVLELWYHDIHFSWSSVFSYFSVWNLLSFIFISDYFYMNELLYKLKINLLLQTFIGGFYISYLFPKYIKIPYLNLIITDIILYSIDFFSHQLPFFYTLFHSRPISVSWSDFIIMNLPITFYIIFFDYEYRYGIRLKDIFFLFFYYIIGFYCLVSFLD